MKAPAAGNRVVVLVALAGLLLSAVAASPILIRHDRDESAYRALGQRYADVLALVRARDEAGIVIAEGTLIDAPFVVTVAHIARHVEPGDSVVVAGRAHAVRSATFHPEWRGREHDIAVLELETCVEGARPLPLYRWDDEEGRQIVVVGRGMFGTGLTGPVQDDGVLRGATNRIERVGPEWLSFVFDAPDSPNATDLEGISGPGDSGGPGILVRDGVAYLAGVSSAQDDSATGGLEGRYGVVEYYTRVSAYASWIDEIVRDAAKPEGTVPADGNCATAGMSTTPPTPPTGQRKDVVNRPPVSVVTS